MPNFHFTFVSSYCLFAHLESVTKIKDKHFCEPGEGGASRVTVPQIMHQPALVLEWLHRRDRLEIWGKRSITEHLLKTEQILSMAQFIVLTFDCATFSITSYICEGGYWEVITIKSKSYRKINVEQKMKVAMSNFIPRFVKLCSAQLI